MQYIVLLALLPACILAAQTGSYSFSLPVGSVGGSSYALTGNGRITAIRVWDHYNYYIYGIQFQFGFIWSQVAGYGHGIPQEINLFDDEAVIQISGTYSHYIRSLIFQTNRGRALYVGRPSGRSFNLFAPKGTELLMISGWANGPITAIGAHWGPAGTIVTNGTSH